VVAAQEETVFDLVRATGCRVAGFDIGVGDTGVSNGAALSNFEVNLTKGAGCPAVTPGAISGATRDSNGVVTATLSVAATPALVIGNEIVITGFSNASFNGTYRVLSFLFPTLTYQTSATGGTTSGTGTVAPYPVGVRVWQNSSTQVRPIINGTINGSDCTNFSGHTPGPIAMELSGGSPFVHNVHTEGFAVGVQIGDLSGTSGATLTNVKPNNLTTTGIVISNQFLSAGSAPGALPTGNINIFNLDVNGGTPKTTNSIIDNINSNTLTQAVNGAVGYYLYGASGVMTSAVPETTLINAFDINGQTTAIYSGSSSPVFSAGPSGVTVGGGNIVQVGSGSAGNGAHILTAQSGTDTDGTCQLNSIVPATCTVHFNTHWSVAPVCVASDQTSASAIKVAPSTTQVVFSGPASDLVAYHCFGNPN